MPVPTTRNVLKQRKVARCRTICIFMVAIYMLKNEMYGWVFKKQANKKIACFLCLKSSFPLIYVMKGGEKDGRVDRDDR